MPTSSIKYGCNPHQTPASFAQPEGEPLRICNGDPSYINLLDGLRAWRLVRELDAATGKAAAASYKHVSPAGAAVAGADDLPDEAFCRAHFYRRPQAGWSEVAVAYARARSADRVASFGDFVAVSRPVDAALAELLKAEVSDGIIAPGYDPAALEVLAGKKGGRYVVLRIDPDFEPPAREHRLEFGITLEQPVDRSTIDGDLFKTRVTRRTDLTPAELEALIVTTVTLKHTQSNSIAVGADGQAIGVGAGQQSRIACTRIACDKADRWLLKQHPASLELVGRIRADLPKAERVNALDNFVRWHGLNDAERSAVADAVEGDVTPIDPADAASFLARRGGVVLSSDAFIPFRDNLDRAAASGVTAVAQAGHAARDADVIAAADAHGMTMAFTGLRLFLH